MIVQEDFITEDGRRLIRTYSDRNVYIERNDGVKYANAVDPLDSGRTYTETDEPIAQEEEK